MLRNLSASFPRNQLRANQFSSNFQALTGSALEPALQVIHKTRILPAVFTTVPRRWSSRWSDPASCSRRTRFPSTRNCCNWHCGLFHTCAALLTRWWILLLGWQEEGQPGQLDEEQLQLAAAQDCLPRCSVDATMMLSMFLLEKMNEILLYIAQHLTYLRMNMRRWLRRKSKPGQTAKLCKFNSLWFNFHYPSIHSYWNWICNYRKEMLLRYI